MRHNILEQLHELQDALDKFARFIDTTTGKETFDEYPELHEIYLKAKDQSLAIEWILIDNE